MASYCGISGEGKAQGSRIVYHWLIMPDTGPSRLLALTAPSTLALNLDPVAAVFAAHVSDPDGVSQVTIWYDRPLATEIGAF